MRRAFGNSVVEVETAVPVFIGYTEKALNDTEDLTGKPWKITSMTEFIQYFGGMHIPKYTIAFKTGSEEPAPSAKSFSVKASSGSEFSIAVATDSIAFSKYKKLYVTLCPWAITKPN